MVTSLGKKRHIEPVLFPSTLCLGSGKRKLDRACGAEALFLATACAFLPERGLKNEKAVSLVTTATATLALEVIRAFRVNGSFP